MSSHTKKIVIAVDTSYNMKNVWNKVLKEIEKYANKNYTKYCLITDKFLIHSWENKILFNKLASIKPYGPTELEVFYDPNKYKEIEEADIVYIFTNESSTIKDDLKYKIIVIK